MKVYVVLHDYGDEFDDVLSEDIEVFSSQKDAQDFVDEMFHQLCEPNIWDGLMCWPNLGVKNYRIVERDLK